MSKERLYIIGAGSVGGHIAWNLEEYTTQYKLEGFFDDDQEKIGSKQFGYKVLGNVDEVLQMENVSIVIGIAFPKVKNKVVEKLLNNDKLKYPSFIHPNAWISKGVLIGKGCVIYPGTTINYGSKVGDFVVMNMNCSIGHHTQIGNYSSFAPGVNTGGHTVIEESVDMGIGSSTIQNIHVGSGSIVGGQSMVIQNVLTNTKVAGVPCKEI
jgi:sugar O-acyltransferase (sialic acid O-acetyltransferase NeuD family)